MSEANTQTVVDDTQASAKPEAQVDSARTDGNDLDSLLAQFEQQSTTRTEPPPPPANQQQQQPVPTQIDPNLARVISRIEREDINSLVKNVKGDLDLDDDIVEAYIDARARKDVRLQRAWLERDTKPQVFEQVAKELGRELAKRNSRKVDPQATEDRNAVAAAVRGASTQRAPEAQPVNHSTQSNAEYRKSIREQYGFDPGV